MTKKSALKLDRKKDLYLDCAGEKGRGLYCKTAIKKGEILEVTPAIILNERETMNIDETILSDYVFSIGALSKKVRASAKIDKTEDVSCVVMGIASYCNHDEKPNAEVVWQEHDGSLYYLLQATHAIPARTEICTSYGDSWFEDR